VPVISITKDTHLKLKKACEATGVKLTYAADQAVLLYVKQSGQLNKKKSK
tara:strand:+ start:1713 stop:1862 length:150 start_codon:yes stop_codon:yes gene_type:complete